MGTMTMRLGLATLAVACLACSGDESKTADSSSAAVSAVPAVGSVASMQPLTLSESDVEHFTAALEELHQAGLDRNARLGPDASDASQLAEGMRGSAEAMAILSRHDFDLPKFQQTAYSVALAIAADEAAGSQPKVDDAVAQVEKLKGQVPKDQYDAMLAAAKSAGAVVQDLQQQPAGNVEAVRKYRERLERIGKQQ